MAYGNFKNLERRGTSDKVLKKIKHITLSKHGYQRGLASMVCKFFDKKTASFADKSGSSNCINNEAK